MILASDHQSAFRPSRPEELLMRTLCLVALLLCLCPLLAAGADPKPKELIVGKWEPINQKEKSILEFKADGKLVMMIGADTFEAKYKFTADDEIVVELTIPGADKGAVEKLKVKVTKDELITIDSRKIEEKLRRIK
jgi:uncharacterized protein (TIGR03066 family)